MQERDTTRVATEWLQDALRASHQQVGDDAWFLCRAPGRRAAAVTAGAPDPAPRSPAAGRSRGGSGSPPPRSGRNYNQSTV